MGQRDPDDGGPRTRSEGARHLRRASCRSGASSLSVDALLRLLWDSSSDAMALCDRNGILLLVNRAFCALQGDRREELVGDGLAAIFPPEARAAAMSRYAALFVGANADPWPRRLTIQRADGARAAAEASLTFVTDRGRRVALLLVLRPLPGARPIDAPRGGRGSGASDAEPSDQGL